MACHVGIVALALAVVPLSGCVTIDGTWASGHVDEVSVADVRAAVAADIQAHPIYRGIKPGRIEVMSRNEIHLHWKVPGIPLPYHDIIKRSEGVWRYEGGIVITS